MTLISEDLNEIIYQVSELRLRIPGDKQFNSFAQKKEFDTCIFHILKCLKRAQGILDRTQEEQNAE